MYRGFLFFFISFLYFFLSLFLSSYCVLVFLRLDRGRKKRQYCSVMNAQLKGFFFSVSDRHFLSFEHLVHFLVPCSQCYLQVFFIVIIWHNSQLRIPLMCVFFIRLVLLTCHVLHFRVFLSWSSCYYPLVKKFIIIHFLILLCFIVLLMASPLPIIFASILNRSVNMLTILSPVSQYSFFASRTKTPPPPSRPLVPGFPMARLGSGGVGGGGGIEK